MDGLNIILLLGLALTLISVLSLLIERLFFPSILAFIAIGVGVGFFWDGNEVFKVAGEIGIILLFFLLGLKFPLRELWKRMRNVWKAGILDIILSFGVSFGIALAFGLDFPRTFLIGPSYMRRAPPSLRNCLSGIPKNMKILKSL